VRQLLALTVAAIFSLFGGAVAAATRDVGPKEGAAVIEANRGNGNFIILDLRTPAEFAEERIAGAVMIDFYAPTFRQELSRLDREKTYFVYCRTGNRSGQAMALFKQLAFQDVVHLATGIVGWKGAGLPTARGEAAGRAR
jgi:rhodanese-related sulfurtransferase